jgi:Sulfotransferase domain
MKNIRRNHTNIFDGCGKGHIEVFSEVNGPRRKKYHPFTGKVGYLQDDGTVDYEGPGNRIFLPQHFWIDRVHNAFPNATWILNLRDVDSWIGSVIKWGDDLHNQFFNEYFMQGAITDIPSENNSTAVNNLLREIYEQHHNMVREFVRQHPSHTLVEVNITDESAGEILGQAFGLDSRAWANINKNRKGQRGSWQARAYPFDELNYFDSPFWWLCFIGTTVYLGWFLGVEVSNFS